MRCFISISWWLSDRSGLSAASQLSTYRNIIEGGSEIRCFTQTTQMSSVCRVLKLIRIISVALSHCIQFIFSCFQVVFNISCASSFTFLFDTKKGENPAQPACAFTCTQEAELMPYSWPRLQKNSFQVTQGTDHSWEPFSDRYTVPFIHLQNTITKKTFNKIAFIPWLNTCTSGKGSYTSSLTLFFIY